MGGEAGDGHGHDSNGGPSAQGTDGDTEMTNASGSGAAGNNSLASEVQELLRGMVMHLKCIHELCTIIVLFQSYLHHIMGILLLFNDF